MKRMLFIVNPRSGREQIKTRLLEILDLFSREGWQVQVHITHFPFWPDLWIFTFF